MNPKVSWIVAACAACFVSSASAVLIAYDGFDYTSGDNVSGLNGGTGWTEAYPTLGGSVTVGAPLSFGSLETEGNAMVMGPNANLSTNGRNWASSAAEGTYWYSFLMNAVDNGTNRSRGTFGLFQNGSGGDNQNGFGIRFDNAQNGNPATTLSFNAQTPAQAPGTNIHFADGYNQTYFVLGKVTVGATNTTNAIWVYNLTDGLPSLEPVTPMSSVTGGTGALFAASYGRMFGNSAPTAFDEIRVGTAFTDVVPVPEASTYAAIAGVAALGLVVLRRRRS